VISKESINKIRTHYGKDSVEYKKIIALQKNRRSNALSISQAHQFWMSGVAFWFFILLLVLFTVSFFFNLFPTQFSTAFNLVTGISLWLLFFFLFTVNLIQSLFSKKIMLWGGHSLNRLYDFHVDKKKFIFAFVFNIVATVLLLVAVAMWL
tara:strand:+ start:219 stop:671 length:453 start_codon:yes stop_codon:yes gene_type:complete